MHPNSVASLNEPLFSFQGIKAVRPGILVSKIRMVPKKVNLIQGNVLEFWFSAYERVWCDTFPGVPGIDLRGSVDYIDVMVPVVFIHPKAIIE
jgi:hypothetical protein